MQMPNITDYSLEEVEVPAPKDEQQIISEVLGLTEPTLPSGPPMKMLKITLEADEFPMTETPFSVSIGGQRVTNLMLSGDGTHLSGLVETMPNQGERIVLHLPSLADESGTVLAGLFDASKLDTGIA